MFKLNLELDNLEWFSINLIWNKTAISETKTEHAIKQNQVQFTQAKLIPG